MGRKIKKLVNKCSRVAMTIVAAGIMVMGVVATNFDGSMVTAEAKMVSVTPQLEGIDGTAGSNANEGYKQLFDGKYTVGESTKWCVSSFGGAYVIFASDKAIVLDGYSFITGNDNEKYGGRNPKRWTLYGCNDKTADRDSESWVEIHSVTNDTTLQDLNCEEFQFEVTGQETAYKYFKLEIKEVVWRDVMQLCGLKLSGKVCDHEDAVKGSIVQPTCNRKGYTNYTCKDCGECQDDFVPASGHVYDGSDICTVCHGIEAGGFIIYANGDDAINSDDYSYGNNVLTIKTDKPIRIENANIEYYTTDRIEVADGVSANITLNGVNIVTRDGAAFKIADDSIGNVTIILADGSENILKGLDVYGLCKKYTYKPETDGKLVIKGENLGTGKLIVTGSSYGIEANSIIIASGDITSINGIYGNVINISGGNITAKGCYNSPGIGAKSYGECIVTITGGNITATGGSEGVGIGAGYRGTSKTTISGGSVKTNTNLNCTLEDGTTKLYLFKLPVDGENEVEINGNKNYPKKHGDENELYVYLPANTLIKPNVIVNGTDTKRCYYDTSDSKWIGIVNVLSADDSVFTYSGEEQTYNIAESNLYTISGNKQTDAGTYTVTVTLAEDVVWADGTKDKKTFEFVINKAEPEVTAEDVTFTYEESGQIEATTDGDGAITYTVVNGNDVISVDENGKVIALKAGTATVLVKATETDNYEAAEKTITVVVNRKSIEIPAVNDNQFIYNGREHTYALTESEYYTITGNKHTCVGKYIVTVALDENMEWSDGTTKAKTYEFVIEGYGLCKAEDGKWYYYNETDVDTDYVGLAKNVYGWWYVENGTVDFAYTGLAKNVYGWWYVTDGKVDFTYTGMAKNINGWFYVKDGKVDLSYTGLATNQYGTWYMVDGKVASNVSGLTKVSKVWMYLVKGKVDTSYVGLAKNENGWWYVENGTVDFTYTGMAKNQYGWWYMTNGKLDKTFTGISSNENGSWYLQNGTVDFTYTGEVEYKGVIYNIKNGKVVK